jgi:hypothetical protein
MFNNGNSNDQTQSHEGDVQLLGPMPAYLMQGGPSAPQQLGTQTNGNSNANSYGFGSNQFQSGQSQPQIYATNATNMDLDQLLGGEEWGGAGLGSMNAVLGGPTGTFTGKLAREAGTSSTPSTGPQSQGVTFDDLNPGSLGWNLDNY